MITALAAAGALALSFAPFLDYPIGAQRLNQFSADQPPAYWFGRAATLLLVIAAVAGWRSVRLATGCADVAIATIAAPVVVTPLRRIGSVGWTVYAGAPVPPTLPRIDAPPGWGLGAMLAVATFAAAVLILAVTRSDDQRFPIRIAVVGLLALGALVASVAVIDAEASSTLGGPRRYVDYLPVASDATFSDANRWFAVCSVVLIVLAAVVARARLSATRTNRSNR